MKNKNGGERDIWIARIACVVLACCLWLYVMSEQNPIMERDFIVGLSQRNLTEGMLVFNMPEKVSVRVRGPRTTLANLAPDSIAAQVDLNKLTVGTHTVVVSASFAKGEVVEVSPRTVSLFIDVSKEKIVPAVVKTLGKPATDVAVAKQVLIPSEVKIRGAATRLDVVDKIVVPVDVGGRSEDFATASKALVVGKDGLDMQDITVEPSQITVRTTMTHQVKTAELPVKATYSGALPPAVKLASITTNPQKITVSGPPSIIDMIRELELEPVDLSKMTKSTTVRANVKLPQELKAENSLINVQVNVTSADIPKAD